jgi:hypothetical protein
MAIFKGEGYMTGNDAAYIKPKFVPDYELLPRDDSGGPDYQPYNMEFGDGGFVTGSKAHLSASGGSDDEEESGEDEQESRIKKRNDDVSPKSPSSSHKYSKE